VKTLYYNTIDHFDLQVYADNFVRREVLSLIVKCPNTDNGCKWTGEVRHLEVGKDLAAYIEYRLTTCEQGRSQTEMVTEARDRRRREQLGGFGMPFPSEMRFPAF
jgi:hypothetical protein